MNAKRANTKQLSGPKTLTGLSKTGPRAYRVRRSRVKYYLAIVLSIKLGKVVLAFNFVSEILEFRTM